jgi:hypothetical protein
MLRCPAKTSRNSSGHHPVLPRLHSLDSTLRDAVTLVAGSCILAWSVESAASNMHYSNGSPHTQQCDNKVDPPAYVVVCCMLSPEAADTATDDLKTIKDEQGSAVVTPAWTPLIACVMRALHARESLHALGPSPRRNTKGALIRHCPP